MTGDGADRLKKIQLAVITGHHAFDAPNFWRMFQSFSDVEVYPQTLSNFCADYGQALAWYDVVLFYNYHQAIPGSQDTSWSKKNREVLEQLGARRQGIVILHHGLVAFPGWQPWSALCGLPDRRFQNFPGQRIRVENLRPDHPITSGVAAWEMVDETYQMLPAGPENETLLATSHPNSLPTIAWARQHGQARVFCCQSGHDNHVYGHPNFRTVLSRAIAWTARCL